MSFQQSSENQSIENFIKSMRLCNPSFLSSEVDKKFLLDNYNYILTDKAKVRLDKLYTYITNGTPVLLEGETGTSKTLSAEIICKCIQEKRKLKNTNNETYIKFNLSAEVNINDLMQKFILEQRQKK